MKRFDQSQSGSNDNQVSALKRDFNLKVSKILLLYDADGTALFRFLRHWMFKWQIHNVEPMDILIEGVRRGLVYIQEKEKAISNPSAWLRVTCLNILKDKIKESIKEESLISTLETLYGVSGSESATGLGGSLAGAELLEQVEQLQKSISHLSSDDQQLIHMRFFEEKTYAQIQKYFQDRDGRLIAEATIRQRESRALKRLRKAFLSSYSKGADATL